MTSKKVSISNQKNTDTDNNILSEKIKINNNSNDENEISKII